MLLPAVAAHLEKVAGVQPVADEVVGAQQLHWAVVAVAVALVRSLLRLISHHGWRVQTAAAADN